MYSQAESNYSLAIVDPPIHPVFSYQCPVDLVCTNKTSLKI